jgi:hypothetical protein
MKSIILFQCNLIYNQNKIIYIKQRKRLNVKIIIRLLIQQYTEVKILNFDDVHK